MNESFETTSHVSRAEPWAQELNFKKPNITRIKIENLGSLPLYAFYLDEDDFEIMTEMTEAGDEVHEGIQKRIAAQCLCENETAASETEVEFEKGIYVVCVELDGEAGDTDQSSEFSIALSFER